MAGETGGRALIFRRTIAQVPAGDISLNAAQAFLLTRKRTFGINIKNPTGNVVRLYTAFPWAPTHIDPQRADSPLLPQNGGDPTANELTLAGLGTDYRTIAGAAEFHFEFFEATQLWLMAEGGAQAGVEITLALRTP
jgi:hypothetical protein